MPWKVPASDIPQSLDSRPPLYPECQGHLPQTVTDIATPGSYQQSTKGVQGWQHQIWPFKTATVVVCKMESGKENNMWPLLSKVQLERIRSLLDHPVGSWMELSKCWFRVHSLNSDFALFSYKNSDRDSCTPIEGLGGKWRVVEVHDPGRFWNATMASQTARATWMGYWGWEKGLDFSGIYLETSQA